MLADPETWDAVDFTIGFVGRQQPGQQPPGALVTLYNQFDRVGVRPDAPDAEGVGGEVPVGLDELVEEVGLEVPLLVAVRVRDGRSSGAQQITGLLVCLVCVLLASGDESADPLTR
ncbi:hypothetical protein AB0L10_43105 [Streptomyces flaveolus]|uniref:hypothetical protein n=1 Tax=Streptomyces flaveolus TaxID=67297 RepID=UPI003431BE79